MRPSKESLVRAIMKGTIRTMYGVKIYYSNYGRSPMLYEVALVVVDPTGKALKFEIVNVLAKNPDEAKMKVSAESALMKNLGENSINVYIRPFV